MARPRPQTAASPADAGLNEHGDRPLPADSSATTFDAVTGTPVGDRPALPLTERILARLPGSRLAWVIGWALVPWLNVAMVLVADAAGWTHPTDLRVELFNRVAVSFAILLSLWGAARISIELQRLGPALADVVEEELPRVERLFRGLDSTVAPLLLTLATGLVLPLDEALAGDPAAALIQAGTWLVIGIPLATAVWVYAMLQVGLNRVGRGQLTLKGYRGDPTLGLTPVGSLAFTAFWTLLGAVTPLTLAELGDLPSALVGTLVLIAGAVLFFVSLHGLHRQMSAVKQRELERARSLYRQAYQPVQHDPTLPVLQQQTGLLNAAEGLEKRAAQIQAWPFDDATFARTVTIASSAAATIIARLLLAPTGL